MDQVAIFLQAFLLIFLAEFADKSQLVIMALATRYRPIVVLTGALMGFMVLNTIGVLVADIIHQWLPAWSVLFITAVLFLGFGLQSLRYVPPVEDPQPTLMPQRHLILSVAVLIVMAELGDKTQLTVTALAAIHSPWLVWLGASMALAGTSLLGVWLGRLLLQRLPLARLQQGSGVLFIVFALVAFGQCWQAWD